MDYRCDLKKECYEARARLLTFRLKVAGLVCFFTHDSRCCLKKISLYLWRLFGHGSVSGILNELTRSNFSNFLQRCFWRQDLFTFHTVYDNFYSLFCVIYSSIKTIKVLPGISKSSFRYPRCCSLNQNFLQ